jgi:hypothetical protein
MDEDDALSYIAAQRAKDYQVFTFTTTELALLLWAFSSHMNDIAKLPPVARSKHEPPSCPENDAINQVLEKLAASVAEGMTMEDAAWSCYPGMTPSSTPPGEVAAWWRGWHRAHERMVVKRNIYGHAELVPESYTEAESTGQHK